MSILDTLFNIILKVLTTVLGKKKTKEMKGVKNWKKELRLLADDKILYRKIPKDNPLPPKNY